jgi:hypothetical protein
MAVDLIARALAKAAASGGSAVVPWITPQTGEYLPLFESTLSAQSVQVAANRIWLAPVMLKRDVTLSKLVARLNTNGTTNAKLAIYNANQTTRRPTTLRGGTTNIDATSGGNLEQSISGGNITLTAGVLYFAGIHTGDATQAWQAIANSDPFFQLLKPMKVLADIVNSTGDMGAAFSYTQTFASGLPDLTAASPTSETRSFGVANMPAVWGLVA